MNYFNCSATNTEFYDGKFVSKLVKDPVMLRLILEALIVDDLHHKRQSLDLSQVMSEVEGDPEMIFQKVDNEAEHLLMMDDLPPKADRSTQESARFAYEEELTDDQLDFFGDGI